MAPSMPNHDFDLSTLAMRDVLRLARGVHGGEGPGGDEPPAIPDVPENLADLDEDALRALHTDLEAAYTARREGVRGREATQELAAIREAQGRIAEAVRSIHADAAALEAADRADVGLPEAPAAPDSPAALETAGDPPADPQAPAGDPAAPAAPAGDPANPDDPEQPAGDSPAQVPEGAAVAAANLPASAFDANGNPAPPNAARTRPVAAMVAAVSGSQSVAVGQDLGDDLSAFGRAAAETLASLRPGRDGSSMKARVATISPYEDMGSDLGVELLGSGSRERNTQLIHEAVDAYMARIASAFDGRYGGTPSAQVAAICDPLDIIRTIPDCVTDAEPFADSLPGRAAGRLGFQFLASSVLAEVTGGVTIWDEADQAAVDPTNQATWKPCVHVTCPPISEVIAEAVTACLTFDNTTEISSPERVQDFMRKIAAAKARAKEDRLLTIASTFTHRFRHVGEYGAVPSSILALLTTLEQGWATNRLDEGTLYNWYVPKELVSAWVIDLVGQAFLQDPSVVRDVVGFIEDAARAAGKNVRIIRLLDRSITPTLPIIGGVAEEYLESGIKAGPYETYLIPPEGAIYFSTGEINVGVERSPELMRQNRAQWFAEEYVGLAKHGCQPWYRLELDVCENGTRAALTTPWTCEGAS